MCLSNHSIGISGCTPKKLQPSEMATSISSQPIRWVALYAAVFDRATGVPNLARFVFFDPDAKELFPQWERTADKAVGLLQAEAARSPHSPALTRIVGELATRSDQFRTRWAAHNVTAHGRGAKQFRHHVVGELNLTFNVLTLVAAPGLSLVGYTPEPDTPSAHALPILASWIATDHAATGDDTLYS